MKNLVSYQDGRFSLNSLRRIICGDWTEAQAKDRRVREWKPSHKDGSEELNWILVKEERECRVVMKLRAKENMDHLFRN